MVRKWCKICGQRNQEMKPGDKCYMCGWVWVKVIFPKKRKPIIIQPHIINRKIRNH